MKAEGAEPAVIVSHWGAEPAVVQGLLGAEPAVRGVIGAEFGQNQLGAEPAVE